MAKIKKINKFQLKHDTEKADFVDQLRQIEWKYWVNRPYTVFMKTAFWRGLTAEYFERNGYPGLEPNCTLYHNPDLYYDQKFTDKSLAYFAEYFKTHKMADVTAQLEKIHRQNLESLASITANQNLSIPERVTHFSELACNYAPACWLNIPLEQHFTKRVEAEVPKYISNEIDKFVGDISIPTKKNAYTLMCEELYSGADINEVQRKFGWMKSRDGFTDFYTVEELEEIKKNYVPPHETKVEIPEELEELAEELRELTFFRTDRTDKLYEFFGLGRPFLMEVAESLGISFDELAYFDANSIMFDSPKRYDSGFSYASLGYDYILSNDVLLPELADTGKGEITGKIAFRGKVTGVAKIVTHPSMIGKVKDGDILVAQMTFPSFIGAMQKAAAFVTDEGGITCHAAIIAREMKKPCIVGTKNATKILKDGDMIEVDADHGTVKMLKKAK